LSINIHLEKFEGPMALLLFLIRKNEMDIYDIEIHKITEQYLEYIRVMKELNLELAGDFVAMAATLIHIKSKMLLPQYDAQGDLVEDDPRKELVNRLIEYERFQLAGKQLYKRDLLGREVFARGFKVEKTAVDPLIILDEGGLFSLIGMYRRAIKAIKKNVHVVMSKTQSLSSRILEIRHKFIPGQRVRFDELVTTEESYKSKWVITFISILELGRLGFVSLFQNETYGAIHIDTKRAVGRDVVTQVEELETQSQALQNIETAASSVIAINQEPSEAASDQEIEAAEHQMELLEQQTVSEELSDVLSEVAEPSMEPEVAGDFAAPPVEAASSESTLLADSNEPIADETALPVKSSEQITNEMIQAFDSEMNLESEPTSNAQQEIAVVEPGTDTDMDSEIIPDFGGGDPEPSPAI
jgi:segregation and condensation protein A